METQFQHITFPTQLTMATAMAFHGHGQCHGHGQGHGHGHGHGLGHGHGNCLGRGQGYELMVLFEHALKLNFRGSDFPTLVTESDGEVANKMS